MRDAKWIPIVASMLVLLGACSVPTGDDEVSEWSDSITGFGTGVAYQEGLVRIDLEDGSKCSGFLVGPNLIVTTAHCLAERTMSGTYDGTWNYMRWGYIHARIVYKPSSSEVMCLHKACREANGETKYATLVAWWPVSWAGPGTGANSDTGVLTLTNGGSFLAQGATAAESPPRSLTTSDYLRIFAASSTATGDGIAWIAGYGAYADGEVGVDPRMGWVELHAWDTYQIRSTVGISGFASAICRGDSGGPLYYRFTAQDRYYVIGVASGVVSVADDEDCSADGDHMYWSRLSAKVWMIDHIQSWAGNSPCSDFTTTNLAGDGKYYRCW